MDAKFSRLQNFVNESNSTSTNDNGSSWSRAIFSQNLLQTNLDRVQSFFNKRSDLPSPSSSSNTDDLQVLLQKGDNDPILPALVSTWYSCEMIEWSI